MHPVFVANFNQHGNEVEFTCQQKIKADHLYLKEFLTFGINNDVP